MGPFPGYQQPSPLNQPVQFSRPQGYNPGPASQQQIHPGLLAMLHQILAERAALASGPGDAPQRGYGHPAPAVNPGGPMIGMQAAPNNPNGETMHGNPGSPSQAKLLQFLLSHVGGGHPRPRY